METQENQNNITSLKKELQKVTHEWDKLTKYLELISFAVERNSPTGTEESLANTCSELEDMAKHASEYRADRDSLERTARYLEMERDCLLLQIEIKERMQARKIGSTESLEQLKARAQAEELYRWTHGSKIMPAGLHLEMCERAKELLAIANGVANV